ncbi:PEP/pyruvate-binding domain-containing protein [Methanobacterium sp. ACI-7]|uniref:PEP/pyruvate-binding domain-containing protein n=1 Tax=unclassified Methanobacterium TaxID=2627676 RepID=UPI0039C10C13
MESSPRIIISLEDAESIDNSLVGSKTRNLGIAFKNGFKVPPGFCITTDAYTKFIKENGLFHIIDMEVLRKSLEDMRWEEIWDASLRIRSSFLKAKMPEEIENSIKNEIKKYGDNLKFSIRSSSPAEDSSIYSFAGIHESYTNVSGIEAILESVKLVWASLWSDRAILYREELSLDSLNSSIAVLVQIMEKQPVSGLSFSKDPTAKTNNIIIEVIGDFLSKLVDNELEPEKWMISRSSLEIIEHKKPEDYEDPILSEDEIKTIAQRILKIEKTFEYHADIEWTGKGDNFTVLQVRPITSLKDENRDRQWYLTLTPTFDNLKMLSDRVENELIPEIEREGKKLSSESYENLNRKELAEKIKERAQIYFKWKKIYWDDFIPFAHGIRNFGTYYNDLVKPDNPYEFMELLKSSDLIASKRNIEFLALAKMMNDSEQIKSKIENALNSGLKGKELLHKLEMENISGEANFKEKFIDLMDTYMDVSYDNRSMKEFPEIILSNILQLSNKQFSESIVDNREKYLKKLMDAAGKERKDEAEENLRIGILSWKLRDDDNILFGKIENQFLIFLNRGVEFLVEEKRLDSKENLLPESWESIYDGLINRNANIKVKRTEITQKSPINYKPRQLIGQPSSPGIVTGYARVINSLEDFKELKSGEIIVCDAVQPQMTFIVSIASGIVERRGGMLVHSSIIARELGIPAVNGVSRATELIKKGDIITLNGYLGLVIIGEPEFNLENEIQEKT